jgi:hypothetical protein
MSTAQESIFNARGWREKSPTKTAALRALLSDGRKHSQQALQRAAGMRFGARLFDAHNEIDFGSGVGPLHYQKIREREDDTQVFYRQVDKAHCDICSKQDRRKPSEVIEAQRKRIQELEVQVERLEVRLAYAESRQ